MEQMKKEYNILLKRFYKASQYMDDFTVPLEKRLKYHNEYMKIIDNLNMQIETFRNNNINMSVKEILNGF